MAMPGTAAAEGAASGGPGAGGAGRLFTGLLFALFVIVLLLALVAGTKVYSALSTMSAQGNDDRVAMSLIANTVRAQDAVDAVSEGTGPEGPALVLTEHLASGAFETRIYLSGGWVVEEYSPADAPYRPQVATPLVTARNFDFTYGDGLLQVDTDRGTVAIALRCAEGGGSHGDAR